MNETQKVLFEIVLDNGEFKVRSKESAEALHNIGKGAKSTESGFASMTSGIKTIQTAFKAFIALEIVQKIIQIGKAFVSSGSKLQETRNKFAVTFSSIKSKAEETAKSIEKAFGLAGQEVQAFLSDTGDLLTGLGMTQEKALDLSETTLKLAADLASFTNLEGGTERAVQALTSGLLGEREAMKALGIVINEEMIQNELRAQGKEKLTGLALQEAKAEATLKLALEQSKNAIGDTARSYDSWANVTRRIDSMMTNISGVLGEELLPDLSDLGNAMLEAGKDGNIFTEALKVILATVKALIKGTTALINLMNYAANKGRKAGAESYIENANEKLQEMFNNIQNEYGSEAARYNMKTWDYLEIKAKAGNERAQKYIKSVKAIEKTIKKAEEDAAGFDQTADKIYNKYFGETGGDQANVDAQIKQRESDKKTTSDTGGKTGGDKTKEKKAELAAYYEAIGNYEASLTASIEQEKQAQLANAQAAYDAGLIQKEEFENAKLLIEENYRQQSVIAEASAWQQKQGQQLAYWRASLGFESKAFQGSQMLAQAGATLMNQKNKALFTVGKASSLANMAMSASEAVMKGLSYGPWIGIPYGLLVGTTMGIQATQVFKQKPPQDIKISSGNISMPSFAVGTYKVPYDMTANIHKDEMIISKPFADSVRSGEAAVGAGGGGIVINVYGSVVDTQGLLKIVDEGQQQKASLLGATKYTFKSAY